MSVIWCLEAREEGAARTTKIDKRGRTGSVWKITPDTKV